MTFTTLAVILFCILLNSSAQILLKKTMTGLSPALSFQDRPFEYFFSVVFNPWFITGLSFFVISLAAWMYVLKKVDVSLAYPMGSIGYLITAGASIYYLHEDVSPMRILGILIIIAGIIVLSRST